MAPRPLPILLALCGLCAVAGCKHDEEFSPVPPPSASTASTLPPPASASASASAAPPPPACRVIAVAGAPALHPREAVPDDFMALPAGSKITVEDTRSTRQTTFLGPASVWACVAGDEATWLAQGTFQSVAGAGERPGAQEWITTPEAVIRYASARMKVFATPKGTVVQLSAGAASVLPFGPVARPDAGAAEAGAATDAEGWVRVVPGVELRVMTVPGGPRAAVSRCEGDGRDARALADAMGRAPHADGGANLGEVTLRHVVAREKARAACAVAGLVARRLPQGPERTSLVARADAGDAAWRVVPTGRP